WMDLDSRLVGPGIDVEAFANMWEVDRTTVEGDVKLFRELGLVIAPSSPDDDEPQWFYFKSRPLFAKTWNDIPANERPRDTHEAESPPVMASTKILRRLIDLDWYLTIGALLVPRFCERWQVASRTVRRDLRKAFPALGYPTRYLWPNWDYK